MKLRSKVAIIIITLWAITSAAIYFGSKFILVNSFPQLEQQQGYDNLQRIQQAVDQMVDKVNTMTTNWAVWDDTYKFISDKNAAYIKTNLSASSLVAGDVDMMLYFDPKGNLVEGVALNADKTKITPLPSHLMDVLTPGSKLIHQPHVDSNTKGFTTIPSGVLLIAAHSIVTSNNQGPPNGTIIMARYLTTDIIDKIKQMTKVDVALLDAKAITASHGSLPPFNALPASGQLLQASSSNQLTGYNLLRDVNGKPFALLQAFMPRKIYHTGISTINYYNFAFLIYTITLIISLWYCLQTLIVKRIEKLNNQFSKIDSSNTLYQTLMTGLPDELSSVANLYNQATHDPLTGLANRNLLYHSFDYHAARLNNSSHCIAILFLDIDFFKRINDTLGHDVGDQLLICMSEQLTACIREDVVLVARLGGDEFIVMLVDKNPDEVQQTITNIFTHLSQPVFLQNHELYFSSSMGVSLYPKDGQDIASLLKQADIAPYQAKASGRNIYQYFSEDLAIEIQDAHRKEVELQQAIDNKEFCLHYQPIYDIHSSRIIAFEALLRWQHPKRGLISAMEIIPIAEKSGLIVPIGKWVLHTACKQAKEWQTIFKAHIPISVNLSVSQTRNTSISHLITSILSEVQLDPHLLQLELTETGFIEITSTILSELSELRTMGIQLAVDDFGIGYSGLAHLRQLPVSKLKIDRSFIRDIQTNPDDTAITLAIISIARQLGLQIIAEGVETLEQYYFLLKNKVDALQGNYLSPPLDVRGCEKLLIELTSNDKVPS